MAEPDLAKVREAISAGLAYLAGLTGRLGEAGPSGASAWVAFADYLQSLAEDVRGVMPYPDYLQTEWWRAMRSRAVESAGSSCQLCNAFEAETQLDVHHRTYERRGREWPEDLTVLCRACHGKLHGKES